MALSLKNECPLFSMVVQIGKLEGHFTGFLGQDTQFRFTNGTVWQQAEDRLMPASCYEPKARVVAQQGVCFLEVEGLDQWLQVRRQHQCND